MPFFILFFALPIFAQDFAPQWLEESWRTINYPGSEWYIGFARDKIKGSPESKDYQAIEKNAQNKLSENILVQIQGSTTVQTASKRIENGRNYSESISTNHDRAITTRTNLILAKVDVKSYFDKKTDYIYAFASVKKRDLADFYRNKISSLFSFADKEFIIADYLTEQGKKNVALAKIQAIEDSLKSVALFGSLLQAVENDNSYLEKERIYWKKTSDAKMQLQLGTSVYLDISAKDFYDLGDKLAAQMQENGCNCVITESGESADYLVTIKAKMGSCIENRNTPTKAVYCYADASVTVNNSKYQKPMNINVNAKGGWMNGNKDKAKEETFKELVKSLAEKITQTINQ